MRKSQLRIIAARQNVPLETIVLDYALGVFLSDFTGTPASRSVVFKGGTALKKCYFPGYRFSQDLDFVEYKAKPGRAFSNYLDTLSGRNVFEIAFGHYEPLKPFWQEQKYVLPFWFAEDTPAERRSQKIIIDYLSSEVVRKPVKAEVLDDYGFGKSFISCLSLTEIYAEKVRAVLSPGRGKARDAYDLWQLTGKGVRFDLSLVNRKLAEQSEPAFSYPAFEDKVNGYAKSWKTDMGPLLPAGSLPDFTSVAPVILKEARERFPNQGS